jgi:hypothetical protein
MQAIVFETYGEPREPTLSIQAVGGGLPGLAYALPRFLVARHLASLMPSVPVSGSLLRAMRSIIWWMF